MPIKVNIPQVGTVNFPDGMSADDIHSAVGQIYSQSLTANLPKAAGFAPQLLKDVSGKLVGKPSDVPQLQSSIPTEKIPVAGAMAQPFGELAAGLIYDPEFRNETEKYGAGSAAAVGGMVAAVPTLTRATPAVLKWMVANPGKVALAYEIARQAGVPLPNVLKLFYKAATE